MIPFLLMSQQHIPVNREQKRKFIAEYEKIKEVLDEIELAFTSLLFKEEEFSYDELYQYYLLEYEIAVKWFKEHGKLKVITLDPYYFSDRFKPVEKNSNNIIFSHS